jgi:hypothetical protein
VRYVIYIYIYIYVVSRLRVNVDIHERRVRKCPQGVTIVACSYSLLLATLYVPYIRIYLTKGDISHLLYLHRTRCTVPYTTCLGKGNKCLDGQLFLRPLFVLPREQSVCLCYEER